MAAGFGLFDAYEPLAKGSNPDLIVNVGDHISGHHAYTLEGNMPAEGLAQNSKLQGIFIAGQLGLLRISSESGSIAGIVDCILAIGHK